MSPHRRVLLCRSLCSSLCLCLCFSLCACVCVLVFMLVFVYFKSELLLCEATQAPLMESEDRRRTLDSKYPQNTTVYHNTQRISQFTIIPKSYSTRRIPQGTTLCHVDVRVKQHDAQNCFAKNTSKCLPITDHRCLPPQTLFSLQHVWSFPDENPIPNHQSPLHSICSTFSYSKSVNINLGRGGP